MPPSGVWEGGRATALGGRSQRSSPAGSTPDRSREAIPDYSHLALVNNLAFLGGPLHLGHFYPLSDGCLKTSTLHCFPLTYFTCQALPSSREKTTRGDLLVSKDKVSFSSLQLPSGGRSGHLRVAAHSLTHVQGKGRPWVHWAGCPGLGALGWVGWAGPGLVWAGGACRSARELGECSHGSIW